MRLLMMRHGQTAGNAERRYVGRRTDEPLSEVGRTQCFRAGSVPGVQMVYVSPLLRARQTAQICFPQAGQVVVDGLAEFDFGVFEGRNAREMERDGAYRSWVDGGCVGRCPGGESREEFIARSNKALGGVLREAAQRGDESVVVVAHGGTIMAAFSAFAHAERGQDAYYAWHVDTCEGYVATVATSGGTPHFEDCVRVTSLSSAVLC